MSLLADISWIEFAFYINKSGQRSRNEFMVIWEEKPTGFGTSFFLAVYNGVLTTGTAFHRPYLLAFLPSYVEMRHIETGLVSQMIPGSNVRLLFADTPPSVDNGCGDGRGQPTDGLQNGDEIIMPRRTASSRSAWPRAGKVKFMPDDA
jgi:hypothetical protein